MKYLSFLIAVFMLTACGSPPADATRTVADEVDTPVNSPFGGNPDAYWYEGKAEINTYRLSQARYGELHPGEATLVFVSEDFLTDKQVKNDRYDNPNSTPILKTNGIRRFTTGVYDYSVMTSVFTPTKTDEHPHTMKVTTSSQDWCGQTFGQFNYRGGTKWDAQLRSYFEHEGDWDRDVSADFLEDEVFNRLRIDPEGLPVGSFRILPAQAYLMLMHKAFEAVEAGTSRGVYAGEDFSGPDLMAYRISYPSLDRTLEIVYEKETPFRIIGWTDTYPSRGKQLKTKATLLNTLRAPYWEQNGTDFSPKRDSLGLANFGR